MITVAVLVIAAVGLLWVRMRARRRSPQDARRVLGSVAANLARGVRAGMTPAESLAASADRFVGPVGQQLSRVRDALERGSPLEGALQQWVDATRAPARWSTGRALQPDADDVELLVCAIRFGEPHGAGLNEAFEGVAAALVDRAELDQEIRALSSQAWASVVVLCSLPVVGLVMMAVVAPAVLGTLFGTGLGLGCLLLAGALDTAAVLLARRMAAAVRR